MIECPICSRPVKDSRINEHIDSDCKDHLVEPEPANTPRPGKAHSFFTPGTQRKPPSATQKNGNPTSSPPLPQATQRIAERPKTPPPGTKRPFDETAEAQTNGDAPSPTAVKRAKRMKAVVDAMPLAERMRPTSLDDVCGQELVGQGGMLRAMIDEGKLPSMVLWGRPGTGKTTIARLIANTSGHEGVAADREKDDSLL
jgi:putative ATPase